MNRGDAPKMRLALITDAWEPQTNGVVSTLRHTCRELEARGVEVLRVTPQGFPSVPCPSYPELRLSMPPRGHLDRLLGDFRPCPARFDWSSVEVSLCGLFAGY